jgi:hypothetical protein
MLRNRSGAKIAPDREQPDTTIVMIDAIRAGPT